MNNTNPNPLWSLLTQDEQEEFISIHTEDHPDGENRLNELLDLARSRQRKEG